MTTYLTFFQTRSMCLCQYFTVFTNMHNHLFRNRNIHRQRITMLICPVWFAYSMCKASFLVPNVFLCFCPQTYSQLAHPIQQARALGLLFQSKILDIDNIDVSVSCVHQPSHTVSYFAVISVIFLSLFSVWCLINQVTAESDNNQVPPAGKCALSVFLSLHLPLPVL